MKPTEHADRTRGLRALTLFFLPLAYLSFCLYQVNYLHDPPPGVERSETNAPPLVLAQRIRVVETAPPTPTPKPTTAMRGRRTMVLLVNFRDSTRCGETLTSFFANAAEPELLRVSVHDQIDETVGELPCVDAYCQVVGDATCRRSQITSTKVAAADAKGPTIARAVTEKDIRDEEFCLGLDSHLVFTPEWDTKLVQNWEATENDKAILTVYPKSTEYLTDHSMDDKMGLMCCARIDTPDGDSMIQYQAVHWLPKTNTTKPRLMSQFAGGFNFGPCQAYRDVPNDPFTPILFYGEEYARAARLWTWGYDFYVPSVDVAFHWFEDRKKIWDDDWSARYAMNQRSKRRVRAILGLPTTSDDYDKTDLEKFRLGTKRTFAQWQNFTGIDPLANFTPTVSEQFTNCNELELVPYNNA